LINGESNDYDGRKLSGAGFVVVTINYRIGVLGYFAHPNIDTEEHDFADYGLMDQQFALKWVQNNIAAFGGDPHNVTVSGESAGGGSVLANLVSPASAGLFQHAIAQSGGYVAIRSSYLTSYLAQAQTIGEYFASAVGCASQTPECLRALPVQKILDLQSSYLAGCHPGIWYRQASGARSIPGRGDGFLCLERHSPPDPGWKPGRQGAGRIPAEQIRDPERSSRAAETDSFMACPTRQVSRWVSKYAPVYKYEFAYHKAPMYLPPTSFPYGASRTIELQFLFPLFHWGPQTVTTALSTLYEKFSFHGIDGRLPVLFERLGIAPSRSRGVLFDPRAELARPTLLITLPKS
jgi:para-nitrobenzyl esterase